MRRRVKINGVVKDQRSEMLSPEVMVVLSVTCEARDQETEIAEKIRSGSFERDWTAYIGVCEGPNETADFEKTASGGSKLRPEVALALFPDVAELLYRP